MRVRNAPRGLLGRASAVLFAGLLAGSCAGCPDIPEVCLNVEAGESLNFFDGQSHVVVLYLYPLKNESAFHALDVEDLLNGVRPSGMTGQRLKYEILPGDDREIEEILPRDTGYVGILADFFSGPRTQVVSQGCGSFGNSTILLSASDMHVK